MSQGQAANQGHVASQGPAASGDPSERAVPYYCPYCAGDDLRPSEAAGRAWECRECTRVYTVKFVGLRTGTGTD